MASLPFPSRRSLLSLLCATIIASTTHAAPPSLLPGNLLQPTSTEQTPINRYKKAAPWRIGVSFGGVGNTWIVQMIQEMKYEASLHPEISEFVFTEANWQPAKQVADVEDLLARKVDVLIIGAISQAMGKGLMEKAQAAGVPVVAFGAYGKAMPTTVEVMGGGAVFGRQGGEFLKQALGGKGSVWAFRGVAGVDEEKARYDGFREGIAGSQLKISAEVFGDWNYAKSKQLCENLLLSGKPVDGIWFSGAEMTRACLDVFKEAGKPLVPMTGEGNNGFLRVWKETGVKSVAPLFTPGLGPATVRAAVALLKGEPLYRSYFSSPPPVGQAELDKAFRPDLIDAYWLPSTLPEARLKELFKR